MSLQTLKYNKWGRNGAIGSSTQETIWQKGGIKTYATEVFQPRMKLDGGTGSQEIGIEGIRIIDNVWTRSISYADLNDTTEVPFGQSDWFRIFRAWNNAAVGNELGNDVSIYRNGVVGNTECKILDGNDQSQIACITVPDDYICKMYQFFGGASVASAQLSLYSRLEGKVFRLQDELEIGTISVPRPYPKAVEKEFPQRTDIEFRGISTSGQPGTFNANFDCIMFYRKGGQI